MSILGTWFGKDLTAADVAAMSAEEKRAFSQAKMESELAAMKRAAMQNTSLGGIAAMRPALDDTSININVKEISNGYQGGTRVVRAASSATLTDEIAAALIELRVGE